MEFLTRVEFARLVKAAGDGDRIVYYTGSDLATDARVKPDLKSLQKYVYRISQTGALRLFRVRHAVYRHLWHYIAEKAPHVPGDGKIGSLNAGNTRLLVHSGRNQSMGAEARKGAM